MFLTVESNILRALALFVGERHIRPYLRGISFRQTAQGTQLAATDGTKLLAYLPPGTVGALPDGFEAIVPVADLPKKPGPVTLAFSEGKCTLAHGAAQVSLSLIDGPFPGLYRLKPSPEQIGEPAELVAEQLDSYVKACKLVKAGQVRWMTCGRAAAIVSFSDDPAWVGLWMSWAPGKAPGQRHETAPDWLA